MGGVKRMREMGRVRFVVRGVRGVGWGQREKGAGWCTPLSMKFVHCGTQGLRRRSVRAGELSTERSKCEGRKCFSVPFTPVEGGWGEPGGWHWARKTTGILRKMLLGEDPLCLEGDRCSTRVNPTHPTFPGEEATYSFICI